ncbi:hypothetical protein A2716_01340 [candidate division WWE3 bacterium RIFCSPHIGHO2_01_FULL_40_23]|uniref:Uncharacterized protein n=1 Tax=candidate division WWE3 bacterium RIFCSPLOWO2_01_FULL_41_18 TaxID=1802625 RepID=A0A1F4VE06_UNCKA|nr:MAG: hypothetical protein A2716_01340 [candidate division WWE3 bacterium RIFCSPHIGHO2_01_FULL_40_23]OGC55375.1 MAG: hypothetical protein A3A78_00245 [candidate division WWE3 bacterium RIFCSPLOWO2_01_FULL_41_18]
MELYLLFIGGITLVGITLFLGVWALSRIRVSLPVTSLPKIKGPPRLNEQPAKAKILSAWRSDKGALVINTASARKFPTTAPKAKGHGYRKAMKIVKGRGRHPHLHSRNALKWARLTLRTA